MTLIIIKINNRPSFFDNIAHPMQDSLFAFCGILVSRVIVSQGKKEKTITHR